MTANQFFKLREIGAIVKISFGGSVFHLDLSDDCYSGFSVINGFVRFLCCRRLCIINLKYISMGDKYDK